MIVIIIHTFIHAAVINDVGDDDDNGDGGDDDDNDDGGDDYDDDVVLHCDHVVLNYDHVVLHILWWTWWWRWWKRESSLIESKSEEGCHL